MSKDHIRTIPSIQELVHNRFAVVDKIQHLQGEKRNVEHNILAAVVDDGRFTDCLSVNWNLLNRRIEEEK